MNPIDPPPMLVGRVPLGEPITIYKTYRRSDDAAPLAGKWEDCKPRDLTPFAVLSLLDKGYTQVMVRFNNRVHDCTMVGIPLSKLRSWATDWLLVGRDLSDTLGLIRLHQKTGSELAWKAIKHSCEQLPPDPPPTYEGRLAYMEAREGLFKSMNHRGFVLDPYKNRVWEMRGKSRYGARKWRSYRKGQRSFTQERSNGGPSFP